MILKFDDYFLPVLNVLSSQGTLQIVKLRQEVAKISDISEEELSVTNERGTNIFQSRVGWAVQYLFQAEALDRPGRGIYAINELGINLIKSHPAGFKEIDLAETPGYIAWVERCSGKNKKDIEHFGGESGSTPQENIEASLDQIDAALGEELVAQIQEMPSEFLEKIVLLLLEKMGYGDGKGALKHLGGSGDEGVDGEIKQDRLGIQRIYVQAKRYKTGNNIGRETLQSFMGALTGQGASGGIFITTSTFTKDALSYVEKTMNQKIVLIDAERLGQLLIEHQVGTVVRRTYHMMEIDENFFTGAS
jgi:restriction system protein